MPQEQEQARQQMQNAMEAEQMWTEIRNRITPCLQGMANASVEGNFQEWAHESNEVLKVLTSVMAPELLEDRKVIAPWQIPAQMMDVQMIWLHTQLGMMMKVLDAAGVFKVMKIKEAQKEYTGLVDTTGRPLISKP